MAQIIKHRRGSIDSLAGATAKKGELVMATGSIENMNGPWIFVGETEGTAGAFRTLSKIYQGSNAPDLTGGTWGSTLNGTPFYGSTNQTLYILSNAGNVAMDLTGNIEGNVISGVTINNLTGSTGVFNTFVSASALNVSGDTAFNGSVKVTGLTDNRLVIVGTGGLLEDSADLTFDGTKFNIGQGQFEVDNSTGNIRTSGSITMKGNITIGDNTGGDVVNLNAEISSSLVPSGSNLFDLGSPTNAWKDIYVSGTAFIENINLASISVNSISLPDDLTVSGTTTLSGSVYVKDLTEKRLVVAGTDGILTDYSGLTFDNGNLNLSGALEVTNIQGTGSLYLKPDLNDSRDFRIYNTAPSDIHIKGNAAYSFFGDDTNFLKIDDSAGTLTLDSLNGVLIDIDTTVSQSLSVDGHINLTGTRQIRVSDDTANTIYGFYDGSSILGSYYQMFGNDYATPSQRGGAEFVFDSRNSGTGGFNVAEYNGTTWLRKFSVSTSGVTVTGTTTLNGNTYVTGLTDNRIVIVGTSGLLEDDANFTFDGTTFKVGDGDFEVDVNDGDIRSSGSLQIGRITDIGTNDLSIDAAGDLFLSSSTAMNIQLNVMNDESGNNYLWVQNEGVGFQTYDFASGLNHTVYLDNTGSLNLTNVNLHLSGGLNVNGNSTFDNDLIVKGDMYVSGNFQVLGTGSIISLTGSQVDFGTNMINLNTYAPFERFAGINVFDSGSNIGVTGSLFWDSQNNVWIYANPSGSSYASARFIAGPKNTGSLGEETGLTIGHFPIAVDDDHIADSLLTYQGTTLAFNTNKFTIDSGTGDTEIFGNLTLSYSGATDGGNETSYVVFRNDDNEIGYVNSNDTLNVLDQLLGYNTTTGILEFSSVIDGGSY